MIHRDELAKTDFSALDSGQRIPRVRPGDILRLDFLQPLGLSAYALAKDIGVPSNRITGIINGTRDITAETAILLGERLGTTAELWMNLQVSYDLATARETMLA